MTAIPSPRPLTRDDGLFLGALALVKLLIHLPVLGRYGYHHDELYFLACGDHLAFGYVDHAPLVPWIARLADELFGRSLIGLRIFPALAGVAAVFMTGLLTRRLGGGRFAQLLACLAVMLAPVYLRTHNLLHLPAFELLFWIFGVYLLVKIIDEDDPKLWLWVGLVSGLGLLTKHSMLFFGFGLVAALAATPLRRHFRSPWLYAGGAVAALVFLPNLIWQVVNGWPTIEFLRQLNAERMADIPALQFVAGQVLYLGPGSAPIWIAGLVYFFSRAGRRYRALGILYASIFLLLLVVKSKIYYLAPAYPMLLAGGAVLFERLAAAGRSWMKPAVLSPLVALGVAFAPLSLPILSIDATERYISGVTFGAFGNIYELTADLRGMFAWEKRAKIVAGVYHALTAEDREASVVIASWYGPAAAVDYFGKPFGLPDAVSTHMTYHLWGLPEKPLDVAVAVDMDPEELETYFEDVEVAADVELDHVNPWERRFVVSVCRRPKVDIRELWPEMRRY